MASIPTLRLSHPFPPTQLTPPQPKNSTRLHPPPARAAEPNQPETTSTTPSATDAKATDDFDARLSQVRLKYRSGTGKKAEQRRAKTRKKSSSPSAAAAATMMLPPVPLKEPTSGGAKVELGFAPYGERLNGKVAALGLAALLLVELGSGKGLLRENNRIQSKLSRLVQVLEAAKMEWEEKIQQSGTILPSTFAFFSSTGIALAFFSIGFSNNFSGRSSPASSAIPVGGGVEEYSTEDLGKKVG